MFCKNCGKEIADDARFCAACGAPVQTVDGPEPPGVVSTADATMGMPPVQTPQPVPVPPPHDTASMPGASQVPPAGQAAPPAGQAAPTPPPTAPQYATTAYPPPPQSGTPPYGTPPYGTPQYGAPAPKRSRTGLWVGIGVAAVIVIAAAILIPLLLRDGDDDVTTGTTGIPTTTATTEEAGTTTVPPSSTSTTTTLITTTTTTASTTTTTLPAGLPGDSPGRWVEMDLPGAPAGAFEAAVSDEAVLVNTMQGDASGLYAYLFESGSFVQLPVDSTDLWGEDIDGRLAVWWEADYSSDTGEFTNEHVYAYRLPDGPRVEIAGGDRQMSYPQIAGPWVTWVEGEPWEENPEEYYLLRVMGVEVDENGAPLGDPAELVPSATAFALGDSVWVYSLSETHLAWEQAAPVGMFEAGTHAMDLGSLRPVLVGMEAWRPSIGGNNVVYYEDGLKVADLVTGAERVIDPQGDFASAAPTFAAYFRYADTGEGSGYEIVARGYNGDYEQVLSQNAGAPWLSPFIGVSETHVAFTIEDVLHVFEWRSE